MLFLHIIIGKSASLVWQTWSVWTVLCSNII